MTDSGLIGQSLLCAAVNWLSVIFSFCQLSSWFFKFACFNWLGELRLVSLICFPGEFLSCQKWWEEETFYVQITGPRRWEKVGNIGGKIFRTNNQWHINTGFTNSHINILSMVLTFTFTVLWYRLLAAEKDVTDWPVLYTAVSVAVLYCTHVFQCWGGPVWCAASYASCGCWSCTLLVCLAGLYCTLVRQ